MSVNVGMLTALTLKASFKELTDQIFVGTRTLRVLNMKPGFRRPQVGGDFISVPIRYKQNSNVKWMTDTDNYSIAAQNPYDAAEFEWRMIGTTVSILKSYEVKNKGKSQIIDLIENLKNDAQDTLREEMNAMLFNDGTDPKAPVGLEAIITTTGTYGGIARSGNTWWQAQVDATAEAFNVTQMDRLWNLASANRTQPDCIPTTRTLQEKYIDDARQFLNINLTRNADLGFESVKYRDVPVFWDDDCPDETMYLLNSGYLHLVCDPDNEYKVEDVIRPDQPAKIIPIEWWGNLVCRGPRYQGALRNKTVS